MRRQGLIALGAVVGVVAGACAAAGPAPATRAFNMTAVEYKGSTETAKEPFPVSELPGGGGYLRKEPKDGKWETSTYRWEPGLIVAYEGDQVELQLFGVNGAEHPARIEGYEKTFTVKRGEYSVLRFRADKVGMFRITCDIHQPSMNAWLMVMPRR